MRPPLRNNRAFTLIEVVLALMIFSVAITGIIQAIAVQVRTQQLAEDITRATFLADNLLDEIRFNQPLEEDEQSGVYTGLDLGFSWSYIREETGQEGLDKYTVTITWQDGRAERTHVLEALLATR